MESLLLNSFFTAGTSSIGTSDITLNNGFWSYKTDIGGDLVNQFNVKTFLDNPQNEQIALNFLTFLQQNFTNAEIQELIDDNNKLAATLNDYYSRVVRNNETPTTDVANQELFFTSATTYTNNNFITSNIRSQERLTELVGFNTGDSYYISFKLVLSQNLLDNPSMQKYTKDTHGVPIQTTTAEQFRYIIKTGNSFINIDEIKTKTTLMAPLMIHGFVNQEFDDSESLFYH